jgi:CRP-like cAMP-binding protein
MMDDLEQLKRFSPLDALTDNGLRQAAGAMTLRKLEAGARLFNKGDRDNFVYFLLDGTVSLRSDPTSQPVSIRADTDAARVPLSRLKPRRYTATSATAAIVAVIDEDLLDNLLTADQTAAYEVTEIAGEDPEWMFRLVCSPAFARVPTDNLATLFSRLQPMEARDGEVIIRQGETGDYYYIIRRGQARVLRSLDGDKPVKVAELGTGDAFGEEALLSGEARNATVMMNGDGQLMRLSLADFNALLKPALAHRIDSSEAASMVGEGARFLDVRTTSEFRQYSLPKSINMPLCFLRELSGQLDQRRPYITICQTGRRAAAAAFLLGQRGFNIHILDGGLDAIKPAT